MGLMMLAGCAQPGSVSGAVSGSSGGGSGAAMASTTPDGAPTSEGATTPDGATTADGATTSAGAAGDPAATTGSTATSVPSAAASEGSVTETPPSDGWRSGVFPTTRVELPRGAIPPEGVSPTPDADLTAADLTGLLTSAASVAPTDGTCTAEAVTLSLSGLDAALGHRYAQVLARNTSGGPCQLVGWPGLGVRGQNGTAFPVVAERADPGLIGGPPAAADAPVTLAPGETAAAQLEWTGSLAGAYDEHASLIVVQFAEGQIPGALTLPTGDEIDLGPDTTVRVGPWGRSGEN